MLDRRQREDLDRHITGNGGEDSVRYCRLCGDTGEIEEITEDESTPTPCPECNPYSDQTFVAGLEAHERARSAGPSLLAVCQETVRVLRFRLIHASPWGAELIGKLEAAIKEAEGDR